MALPKNRKQRQLKVRFRVLPVPLTVAIILFMTYSLGWIWLEVRCESIGGDIKRLEAERENLQRRLQTEQFHWARLKSPHSLETELERRGIEMNWPRKDQVVRVSREALLEELNDTARDGVGTYAKVGARE